MHYVGLDLHQRTSTIHILDHYGRKVKEKTIRGHWHNVVFPPVRVPTGSGARV